MPGQGAIGDDVEIFLHIGQMKTGTTSLQCTLERERSNLLTHGVLYPTTGALPKHSDLVWSLLSHKKLNKWVKSKYNGKNIDELLNAIATEIILSGSKKIIISAEEFSLSEPTVFRPIFDAFTNLIQVIIYLRRQDEMLESMYKQQLRHKKMNIKFDAFVSSRLRPQSPLGNRLDYDKFLLAWESEVGKDKLRLSLFEGEVKANLWRDFTRLVGIDIVLNSPMVRENVSVEGKYLEFLRRTNRYLPNKVRSKFMRDLDWLMANGPKSALPVCSGVLREEILARYESANREVARRYFGRETLFEAPLRMSSD